MGRKRPPCYQCGDTEETLDEIRERRNEEVRAWGRKQLADADALIGIATPLSAETQADIIDQMYADLVPMITGPMPVLVTADSLDERAQALAEMEELATVEVTDPEELAKVKVLIENAKPEHAKPRAHKAK